MLFVCVHACMFQVLSEETFHPEFKMFTLYLILILGENRIKQLWCPSRGWCGGWSRSGFMFAHQIAGQNHNIVMTNKSFELWQRSHVGNDQETQFILMI